METSTACLEITRSIHDKNLFTTWVGLSIICAHPAYDVKETKFLALIS